MNKFDAQSRLTQILLAAFFCAGVALCGFVLKQPLLMAAASLAPIALIVVLRAPLIFVLAFTVFSFFRIHEVFPELYPLRIPQLLAMAALLSLIWGIWSGRIKVYLTRELAIFACFFALVSLGLLFATNREEAFQSWSGTYLKIAIMTFAIAWLVSYPSAYRITSWVVVAAGTVVGLVALYNQVNGIGLVEGTRVTISRDIGSMLGDPNDLALVLLFPASFTLAILLGRGQSLFEKLLAGSAFVIVSAAIVATQSRGGLLGITAVMGVYAWRRVPNKSVLIAAGAVALILLFIVAGVSDRASGGAAEEGIDESAMGRIYAWGAAWNMALSHPVTGVGINNFLSNYWAYSAHWDGKNHAVHSTWFGVLAETGLVGFVLFMSMVTVGVRGAMQSVARLQATADQSQKDALTAAEAVEAGLVGFIVSGTFLTMGFTWPFYILLALASSLSQYSRRLVT